MKKRRLFVFAVALAGCDIPSRSPRALADRELAASHYQEALTAYRALDQHQPDGGPVQHQMGVALYRLGRYPEAAVAFRSAASLLTIAADRARSLHNLGNALAESGRPTEALEAYRQALGLADRDTTRLNYELVRDRLSRNPPAAGGDVRSTPAADNRLFEAARELDVSPDTRPAPKEPRPRVRDW